MPLVVHYRTGIQINKIMITVQLPCLLTTVINHNELCFRFPHMRARGRTNVIRPIRFKRVRKITYSRKGLVITLLVIIDASIWIINLLKIITTIRQMVNGLCSYIFYILTKTPPYK